MRYKQYTRNEFPNTNFQNERLAEKHPCDVKLD